MRLIRNISPVYYFLGFVYKDVFKGLDHSSNKSRILASLDAIGEFRQDLEIARLVPLLIRVKKLNDCRFVPVLLMRRDTHKVRKSAEPVDNRSELSTV